jgi:hypothetical protein
MNRLLGISAALLASALVCPAAALAYDPMVTPLGLHMTVSAAGLVIAIMLLIEALMLRRVAYGGAIAEKLHFVILAIVCLGAAALASWASNFVSGVTLEQTRLAGEMLVLLAMALLFGYFYSVRTAMQSYLKVLRQELPQSPGEAPNEAPAEAPAGSNADTDVEPEAETRG